MIPIVKDKNLPFQQEFGKRKVVLLKQATRYTDGKHSLLWLQFQNRFYEPTLSIQFELTQLNENQQVIDKSVITQADFFCRPNQKKVTDSPLVISDRCQALTVRVLSIRFKSMDLKLDLWQPLTPSFMPVNIPHHKSNITTKLSYQRPLRWLLLWVLFWLGVTTIIAFATLQFGLI